jgi:hypothetical protein
MPERHAKGSAVSVLRNNGVRTPEELVWFSHGWDSAKRKWPRATAARFDVFGLYNCGTRTAPLCRQSGGTWAIHVARSGAQREQLRGVSLEAPCILAAGRDRFRTISRFEEQSPPLHSAKWILLDCWNVDLEIHPHHPGQNAPSIEAAQLLGQRRGNTAAPSPRSVQPWRQHPFEGRYALAFRPFRSFRPLTGSSV